MTDSDDDIAHDLGKPWYWCPRCGWVWPTAYLGLPATACACVSQEQGGPTEMLALDRSDARVHEAVRLRKCHTSVKT